MIYSSLRLYLIQQNSFTYVYVFSLEDNDFFFLKKYRRSIQNLVCLIIIIKCYLYLFISFSFSSLYNTFCLYYIRSFCSISSRELWAGLIITKNKRKNHFCFLFLAYKLFHFSSENRRQSSTGKTPNTLLILFIFYIEYQKVFGKFCLIMIKFPGKDKQQLF